MSYFEDLLSLVGGALSVFAVADRAIFWLVALGGVVLASGCWLACGRFSTLWNKGFKVSVTHHMLCALAALITLPGVVVFAALKHSRTAAEKSVALWKVQLDSDEGWANQTFRDAYDRVCALGVEDLSKYPPPPLGNTIPTTTEQSKIECALAYGGAAAGHFNRSRPFLSSVAKASTEVPRERMLQDLRAHFAAGYRTYPTEKAIAVVGHEVMAGLQQKLPRVVAVLRVQIVVLFLVFQIIPFGLVAWAAYANLKIRT